MSEKEEEKKEEPTPTNNGEGDKSESTSLIDRASAERERMEKVLEELKVENTRKEELMAREALGGKSEGKKEEEPTPEITPAEYAANALKGKYNDKKE